jgi:hypothetical protein
VAPPGHDGPAASSRLPFTAVETIFKDPAEPHAYTGTDAVLRELPPAALEATLDIAGATHR